MFGSEGAHSLLDAQAFVSGLGISFEVMAMSPLVHRVLRALEIEEDLIGRRDSTGRTASPEFISLAERRRPDIPPARFSMPLSLALGTVSSSWSCALGDLGIGGSGGKAGIQDLGYVAR
jgi:hypothetical protein